VDLGSGAFVILFAVIGIPLLLIIVLVAAARRSRGD
jgi:hypothetical protein